MRKLDTAYDAIAQLLPTEGRDYRTHVVCSGADVAVRLEGITTIGKAFAEHCRQHLAETMKDVKDGKPSGQKADRPVEGSGAKPPDPNPAGPAEEQVL